MHKLNMTPWKQKTLAAAATLALAGLSLDVSAFALGAVTVHSHLGEPLRAEIEVPQISEAEAKTLQATLASPQAFQAAGVEYNPAVVGVRVTLGSSLRQKLAQVRDAQVGVRARLAYLEQVSLFHKRLEIGPGRRVDDSVRLSVPRDGELGFGVEHGPA